MNKIAKFFRDFGLTSFLALVGITLVIFSIFAFRGVDHIKNFIKTEATVSEETEATTTEEEWSLPPPPVEVISDEFNVIENPNFEEDDVSMWSGDVGSSKIVIGNDANEALTNYTNYALVDRDPATASP